MHFYSTITMIIFLCVIITQSTWKSGGVSWNEKKNLWQAEFYINGKKYVSYLDNKFDASKKLNELCDKMAIPLQHSNICEIINELKNEMKSQYKGVYWNKKHRKWYARICLKEQKKMYGGHFNDELDAGKAVNKLCEKLGIPLHNPSISAIPNQQYQRKEQISQYKGVTWHKKTKKWYVQLQIKGRKQKFGGSFKDEQDAGKRVNQVCGELGIPPKNPAISATPNQQYQSKEKSSQYIGVYWHKHSGKWQAVIYLKEKKKMYGGTFNDELDAAKRVNQLCEKLRIRLKNPTISAISNQQYQKTENTSQYKGVNWHKPSGKWMVSVPLKGKKKMYGGCFIDELDAAKRANQICVKLGIPLQNPTINGIPNQQYEKKEKTSQYIGVYWNKKHRQWYARVSLKGQKKIYGGHFNNEIDAAKKVNQLCVKVGICPQNPTINTIPNKQQKKEKTSHHKGVSWHKERKKWCVLIHPKGQKAKFGGWFKDELDAAERASQICQELGTSPQNPSTVEMLIQHPPEECKNALNYDGTQTEFEDLIKIVDASEDHDAIKILKNMIAAINYQPKTILEEVNLRTKNGESVLSIAAQYGFSKIIKFLILKGADKEHFTNQHHTPLSLAVYYNHLKVVQVLFENWMSPNSYEKPYLHLSPIFNVKSREIAQLLIDNDAITHEIYNDKNQSPLTVACKNGYLGVVEFFLDDGLDINHLDNDKKTPLFYALTNKHQEIANLLISKGAQNVVHL